MKAVQCFGCKKFAKVEDCVLLRNKHSGNRRWFHQRTPYDCIINARRGHWEYADQSLGETTEEEERQNAGLDN